MKCFHVSFHAGDKLETCFTQMQTNSFRYRRHRNSFIRILKLFLYLIAFGFFIATVLNPHELPPPTAINPEHLEQPEDEMSAGWMMLVDGRD